MRRGKPKPILYMFVTCFLKGAGIGAVCSPLLVFYGSVFEYSDVATPVMVILSSVVVGIMGGAFWGAIIGIIGGIIFTPLTYIAYRFRNPNTVSAVMKVLITLIGGVLLMPFFMLGFMDWLLFSGIILPIILITLMLLQCTRQYFAWVQRYIWEQDPRKEKRKVKNSERLAMRHAQQTLDDEDYVIPEIVERQADEER